MIHAGSLTQHTLEGRQGAGNQRGRKQNSGPQGVHGGNHGEGQGTRSQKLGGSYKVPERVGRTGERQESACRSEGPRKSEGGVRVSNPSDSVPSDRYSLTPYEGPLTQPQPVVPPKSSSDGVGISAVSSGTIYNVDALGCDIIQAQS